MKGNKKIINDYIDPRLIKRLRIYLIIMSLMLILIAYEVVISSFTITMAILGILVGLIIGRIISGFII